MRRPHVLNFRVARQPPTIVTWAELHFYDLPLIRPSGFVNSGRQRSSSQELLELLGDGRRYDYHRVLSRFLPIIPNRHVIPPKQADLNALKIEIVQRKQLAYELCRSR